ncbi:MAG TPA: acyl-CoA dehydrogenase family protein [Acidobacteriota bacterium]|nr:acyl-CoA dehydrogenase family protein [Acidobacteriota bacterium]
MSTTLQELKLGMKGGGFLLEEVSPSDIFTPEEFSEEQKMIAQTVDEFMTNEVLPLKDRMEKKDLSATIELLRKAAELGLCGVEVPEKYSGLGLDKVSAMLVAEKMTRYGSFAVSYGGHTGIGSLPIVYFGTEDQKKKYLPRLVSSEILSSYALTEAHSGSDALAARTTAVLSPDGKEYILNGTKMWITNAGFADIFITFAKIDGDKFSAFIVEKGFSGVSTGAEERKMGINGSSTRTLILEDARVPAENLLGEIGKGHKIAFSILNIGRFKLGAACIGGSKRCIEESVKYANERHQFGKSIGSFGAIKHKLGEMATRAFVGESMVYRTAGLLDRALERVNIDDPQQALKAMEEYAVECAAIKVMGSEFLDYVVDESVQIFGGYGYSQEYPVEMPYRDSRINRIFEGTNEINRLLILGMLLKRAMKGELPLMAAAQKLQDEVLGFSGIEEETDGLLARELKVVRNMKKLGLLTAGLALQKYMTAIEDEQEILSNLSDIVMEAFAAESALLRTLKMSQNSGSEKTPHYVMMTQVYINDAISRVEARAKDVMAAISEGDMLRTNLAAMKRFLKFSPINTIELRRKIADRMLETNSYPY